MIGQIKKNRRSIMLRARDLKKPYQGTFDMSEDFKVYLANFSNGSQLKKRSDLALDYAQVASLALEQAETIKAAAEQYLQEAKRKYQNLLSDENQVSLLEDYGYKLAVAKEKSELVIDAFLEDQAGQYTVALAVSKEDYDYNLRVAINLFGLTKNSATAKSSLAFIVSNKSDSVAAERARRSCRNAEEHLVFDKILQQHAQLAQERLFDVYQSECLVMITLIENWAVNLYEQSELEEAIKIYTTSMHNPSLQELLAPDESIKSVAMSSYQKLSIALAELSSYVFENSIPKDDYFNQLGTEQRDRIRLMDESIVQTIEYVLFHFYLKHDQVDFSDNEECGIEKALDVFDDTSESQLMALCNKAVNYMTANLAEYHVFNTALKKMLEKIEGARPELSLTASMVASVTKALGLVPAKKTLNFAVERVRFYAKLYKQLKENPETFSAKEQLQKCEKLESNYPNLLTGEDYYQKAILYFKASLQQLSEEESQENNYDGLMSGVNKAVETHSAYFSIGLYMSVLNGSSHGASAYLGDNLLAPLEPSQQVRKYFLQAAQALFQAAEGGYQVHGKIQSELVSLGLDSSKVNEVVTDVHAGTEFSLKAGR